MHVLIYIVVFYAGFMCGIFALALFGRAMDRERESAEYEAEEP